MAESASVMAAVPGPVAAAAAAAVGFQLSVSAL